MYLAKCLFSEINLTRFFAIVDSQTSFMLC